MTRRDASRPPALILDAELRQALASARALEREGVRVFLATSDADAPAFASRCCAGCSVFPDLTCDREGFVDGVLKLCTSLGSPVLITSHDGTIEALRSRREEVESVARLALAREEALGRAVDKRATLGAAERLGIPVPPGRTVDTLEDAEAAVDDLGLPVVVKAAFSWVDGGPSPWRASPALARTRETALSEIRALNEGGVAALVQRWLSGSRDAVSVFIADGVVWARLAVRAMRTTPLVGGSAVMRETISMPDDIGPAAEALVRELRLEGFAQVEWRRDGDGRAFLMEVNPRLNASTEVSIRGGVNVPVLLYRWAAGEPLRPVPTYRAGRRMRWLHGDIQWLREVMRDPEHPDSPGKVRAVGIFTRDFLRGARYDYWDRNDPRPAALIASRLGRSLPRKVRNRLRRHVLRKPHGPD